MPSYTLDEQRELDALIEHETTQRLARRIVSASTVDQTAGKAALASQDAKTTADTAAQIAADAAIASGSRYNDGIPPLMPSGVEVTPLRGGLEVAYTEPADSQALAHAVISVTRVSSGVSRNYKSAVNPFGILGLESVPYSVTVSIRDRFGLLGPASAPITVTPIMSIQAEITADTKVAAGQYSNLLNDPGLLALNTPSKLAEGVVRRVATSTGEGANLLPWHEAEYENYYEGTSFPVSGFPGSVQGGHTLKVNRIGTGVSASNFLEHIRDASSTTTRVFPYSDWNNYGLLNGWFILSAYTRTGPGSPTGRIIVQAADDAAGTNAVTLAISETVTPVGDTTRAWCIFQRTSAKPFLRWGIENATPGSTMRWTRFQLEAVDAPNSEPSPYKIPAMGVGALAARILASWDLTAVRAMIGTATIESAKIDKLTVNKLVGGTISAETIVLGSGGQLRAGQTTLAADGVTIAASNNYLAPSQDTAYSISVLGGWANAHFFSNDDTPPARGWHFRADGPSGGAGYGLITWTTTTDGLLSDAARMYLYKMRNDDAILRVDGTISGRKIESTGTAIITGLHEAQGSLQLRDGGPSALNFVNNSGLNPNISSGTLSVSRNAQVQINNGIPGVPRYIWAQWNEAGIWRPVVSGTSEWSVGADADRVYAYNHATATRGIRIFVIR